jgi:hypothetical protein
MTPRTIDQAHRIHIDQLYRCYRGDRLELQVLKRDSSRDKVLSIEICDTRARAVLHPRQHPPHGARDRAAAPIRDRQSRHVEFGEAEPLAEKYPHVAEENRSSPLSS